MGWAIKKNDPTVFLMEIPINLAAAIMPDYSRLFHLPCFSIILPPKNTPIMPQTNSKTAALTTHPEA